MFHGYWPDQVDHINNVRDDNRIANIRAANNSINARNRSDSNSRHGKLGVIPKSNGSWRAFYSVNGISKSKTFKDKQEAIDFRVQMEDKYYERV